MWFAQELNAIPKYRSTYGPCHEKTNNEVSNRFDTNQTVKAQKMAKRLEILDLESRGIVLSM